MGGLNFSNFRFTRIYLLTAIKSSLIIIILIESISQLYMIADRFFYTDVNAGGIASLNYASSLFLFPIAIFSFALTTAIFPKISDAYSRNAAEELNKIINESVSINIILFIPISFLFILYGEFIVKLAFERGYFTPEGTLITYDVLRIYAFSLVFFSVYAVLNKILYSAVLVKSLLTITIVCVLIKIVLNVLLVNSMQQNGLALSTTISYLCLFLLSLMLLKKKIKLRGLSLIFSELSLGLVNGLLSYLLSTLLVSNLITNVFAKEIISIITFCIFYYINLQIIKHPVLEIVKGIPIRLKMSFREN
jgi:putative peptidoglycan lipid II flippase